MEVQLQAFLILVLDKRVWSTTPVALWEGGWVGPRADLNPRPWWPVTKLETSK